MTAANHRLLITFADGEQRHFTADELPVTIGGGAESDIRLHGVSGSLQIGLLDNSFFIQPGRETRSLRIDGELVTGSRWIKNGATIALDIARFNCSLGDEQLGLEISGVVTGGDTAPPDLEELARDAADVDDLAIAPVAFRPLGEQKPATLRSKPSRSTLAVGSAFALLAVMGWFAFTAKSVELIVEPVPETVGLPGTLMKLRMGERLLLSSGSHRIVAELAGYYPLDTEINVGLSPDQTIRVEMIRLPGLVTLTTEPDVAAEVRLDGARLGTTPLTDAEITTGRHQIEFVAERFLAEVRELDVIGGGERQRLAAELTPNWAPITVTSEPSGAEILVDGTVAGATPLVLELSAGERLLEVRLRGYNAWADVVSVFADQPQTLPPVELTAADGRVELITEPASAAVSVNGEYRGHTPLTLRLAPERQHRMTLTKPGYDSIEQELSVAADSDRTLTLPMTARTGTVQIRSDPAAAEIWVDGERRGVTPAELTLPALSHQIDIRLAGFAEQVREVTPRPGFPQILDVTLEELNTTTGSGYEKQVRTGLGQVLTLIPSGDFTMGSSRREQGRRSNEILRAVSISEAFYLGAREVSNAEFRAFRTDHDAGLFADVSLNEDDQPAVRVTWDEIAEFMNWLSIEDGFQPVYEQVNGVWAAVRPLRNGYRLPTEAEWAWAARFAGQEASLTFPWGDMWPPPDRSGNFADVSAAALLPTILVTYNDSFDVAAPPGSFPPNAVGLYDLGGNVAEWVLDYWEIGSPQTETVAVDPLGPERGRFHVFRGSSWRSATLTDLRFAYRNYSGDSREDIGFRIARNLE